MKLGTLFSSLLLYLCLSFNPAYADIRVGIVFFYPPFVMNDGGGFDVDFIHMVCQRLQQNCQLIPMNYSKLFTSLDEGKIDIAIGGITVPSTHSHRYLYSLPYMLSKGSFLVLAKNNYTKIEDLLGQTLGLIKGRQDGSVFYNFIIRYYPNKFSIELYDTMGDLITALNQGEIATAFIHESSTLYWKQNGGGAFKIIGKPQNVGNGIAILSLPKSQALINAINQQIENIEQDQAYINLYNTYFANER